MNMISADWTTSSAKFRFSQRPPENKIPLETLTLYLCMEPNTKYSEKYGVHNDERQPDITPIITAND